MEHLARLIYPADHDERFSSLTVEIWNEIGTCPTVSELLAMKRRNREVKSVEREHLTRNKIESYEKHS